LIGGAVTRGRRLAFASASLLAVVGAAAGGASLLAAPKSAAVKRSPPDPNAEQRRALSGLDDSTGDSDDEAATGETDTPEGRRDGAADLLPDTHVVKKGDTLWDICQSYFQDPWRWPKVWALNPEISNPHWIFPGQAVKLGSTSRSTPGATADSGAGAGTGGSDDGSRVGIIRGNRGVSVDNGTLREVGFVDLKELEFAGTIHGSREEKIMLASGDQAYVEFSKARPLKAGERFSIYQVDMSHPVKEPGSSITLGYLVRIYGNVSIDVLTDRPIASATLLDLVQPVERGFRVGPLFKQFKTVLPRKNEVSTTARVVSAIAPNTLIAQNMFVVLNRGSRHGIEEGNRFLIIRQGDGYRPVMEDWTHMDHRFPPDHVAELLTVDVREETSVAWVSRGNRDIRIGDVADLKKGY
jgi:hypothetical protein